MDYDGAGVAETYRRARALPLATLALWRDVLRELVAPAGVARIVDVGCGTGRFTGCLVDAFQPLIIGVDPSIGMLAVAERSAAVRYTAGVAEALPLARAGFDLAFMSLMWHHVVDPRAAVAELARVLRPGGSVFLRTPTVEILDAYPFIRFFPESRALDERRMPSRAALTTVFTGHGFVATAQRTVEQRVSDGPSEYADRVRARAFSSLPQISDEAFARGLSRFDAWTSSLPGDQPVYEPVDVFVFRR